MLFKERRPNFQGSSFVLYRSLLCHSGAILAGAATAILDHEAALRKEAACWEGGGADRCLGP